MSVQGYYRRALVLPLLLPALTLPFIASEVRLPDELAVPLFFLYWSLLIGGVPYVLFAAGFLLWSRGRTELQVRRAILFSPVVYAAVLMVCAAAFLAVDTSAWWSNVDEVGALGGIAVMFGYANVLVVELARAAMHRGSAAPVPQPAA